ncbi:MAG: diacylglycerol/lipid kinase family protein [Ilumatobacteraceae bacterium]
MALRILLVVNAFASSVTARNTVVVHRALAKGNDVEVVETNRRGHATRYAQDAARRGVDVVVAFGGDGTLNEVATGVAGSTTALGVLPGGSTNVFARTIGLPNDPVAAVYRLVEGLAAGSIEPIGLGRVNGRYFCFHTGVGFDAAVVREVERRAGLKRWFGHPLFIWAAARTWVAGGGETFTVTTPDASPVVGRFTVVMNTNPYTYLGNRPLDLSRDAGLDRGLVAITLRSLDVRTILRTVDDALRHGGVAGRDDIDVRTDLTEIEVTASRPVPYQVDGDYLGETARLEFRHVPDALRLLRPPAP